MSVIASLVVNLSANVAQFGSGIAKAEKHLSALEKSVLTAKNALIGFGAALGVGFSVNTLKNLVSHSLDAIDVNAKLADRIGATTESLIALQHGAGLAGAELETINGALDKMLRSIGEAKGGEGAAAEAFGLLNLNPHDLALLDAVDAFGRIADAINKIPTAASRATIRQDIFGKSAASLAAIIAEGSKGIATHREEVERLGTVYSRLEADAVGDANDAMARAGEAVKGLGNAFAIGLSPFIEQASKELTGLVSTLNDVHKNDLPGMLLSLAQGSLWSDILTAEPKPPLRNPRMPPELNQSVGPIRLKSPEPTGLADLEKRLQEIEKSQLFERGLKNIKDLGKFGKDLFDNIGDGLDRALAGAAEKLTEELKTPTELIERQFQTLQALHRLGEISDTTFERGLKQLRGELAVEADRPINAPIEAGTVEAFRAARQQENPLIKINQEQLEEEKNQAKLLKDIDKTIRDTAPQNAEVVFQ